MEKKIKGYSVAIRYDVTYDPASEVPGISIFYPEGHTNLARLDNLVWWDFHNTIHEYTKAEAIARAKEKLKEWVSGGRYQHGTITDKPDGTARLIVRDQTGKKVKDSTHKSRPAAVAAWRRFCA